MNINDDELEERKLKTKKLKTFIIISIIILTVIVVALAGLIVYKKENPSYITTYIDGVIVQNFDKLIDIQTDENGKIDFYIPIRAFSECLQKVNSKFIYEDYDGEFEIKTENSDICTIVRKNYEIAVYSKGSKTIYKRNLQKDTKEYEECIADKDVFSNNGVLYASKDGIEKGYNVIITYNEKKKIINIYTLDLLVQNQKQQLNKESFGNYGKLEYENTDLNNNKSIFEDVLIVRASNDKYGLLTGDYKKFILEPKYDKISYIPDSKSFLVGSNGKVGLFDKDGKRKIALIYDNIKSMGKNSNLYVVKIDNQFGVVDGNKNENDNILIYPQYDQIGINVDNFTHNGVKNGYLLLDELIPVKQGNLWAIYNKKGEIITNSFKYTNLGCSSVRNGNNVYPLLQISEAKVIIVKDQLNKYGFMDISGNDSIVPFVLDQIYIKTSNGIDSYWMYYKVNGEEKELNVLDYLKQKK